MLLGKLAAASRFFSNSTRPNIVAGDWDCNRFLPTLAQHVYALQDVQYLGKVGPGTTMFFYSNLFEPGENNPTPQRQTDVVNMCVNWLTNNAVAFNSIVCVFSAYTPFGFAWIIQNEAYITTGPADDVRYISNMFGGAAGALNSLHGCQFQALALAHTSPDVYLFVSSACSKCLFLRPDGFVFRHYPDVAQHAARSHRHQF